MKDLIGPALSLGAIIGWGIWNHELWASQPWLAAGVTSAMATSGWIGWLLAGLYIRRMKQ